VIEDYAQANGVGISGMFLLDVMVVKL